MFTVNDAVIAKYELEKYILQNNIKFNYKYHTHDAALKYMYVISRIESFLLNTQKHFNVLDLGCGNGDALRLISKVYNSSAVGFDPILKNYRIKIGNLRKQFCIHNPKLFGYKHTDFIRRYSGEKFDLIIDLCAVTHFDTTSFEKVNMGWKWVAQNFETLLVKKGKFISATDVAINNSNNEFLQCSAIIDYLGRFGSVSNISEMKSLEGSQLLSSSGTAIDLQNFYRIGKFKNSKNGSIDEIVLGVLGVEITI